MANKRNPELAIYYVHKPDTDGQVNSFAASANILPMAAMFMRSKVLAWAGFFITLQIYLSEPNFTKEDGFGIGRILSAVMGLAVSYMDFVMPAPKPANVAGSNQ